MYRIFEPFTYCSKRSTNSTQTTNIQTRNRQSFYKNYSKICWVMFNLDFINVTITKSYFVLNVTVPECYIIIKHKWKYHFNWNSLFFSATIWASALIQHQCHYWQKRKNIRGFVDEAKTRRLVSLVNTGRNRKWCHSKQED